MKDVKNWKKFQIEAVERDSITSVQFIYMFTVFLYGIKIIPILISLHSLQYKLT